MRILITADLHYNQPKSRHLADPLIEEMNSVPSDALLLVGDTAGSDGDALERCLSRFRFEGPRLFVAGNHELWTAGPDSYAVFREELPRRVRALGWQWLEDEPAVLGDVGIVGSVGWYDYSFARAQLGIPRRFYEAKVSPGAAERFSEFAPLFDQRNDISPAALEIYARWNDGRFVKLGKSDEAFLNEISEGLRTSLKATADLRKVIVATHHVPFAALLPPVGHARWDFARAYLGSEQMGELIAGFPNVSHVVCGHSHFPVKTQIGTIRAINIGSGYRAKTYRIIDV